MSPLVLLAGMNTAARFIDRVFSGGQASQTQRPSNSKSEFARLLMDRLDGNHDGLLTRSEAGIESSLFEKLDANADGTIDQGEMERGAKLLQRAMVHDRKASAEFSLLDANRDGLLSLTESGRGQSEFHRVDRNQNEFLEPREWSRGRRGR